MALTLIIASVLTITVIVGALIAIMVVIDARKRAKLDEFRSSYLHAAKSKQPTGSDGPKTESKERTIESTERIVVPRQIFKYEDEVTPADYKEVVISRTTDVTRCPKTPPTTPKIQSSAK